MKVAVIGTGIAGNVAAYKLRQQHDITVFEASSYIGGHTNTVDVYEGVRKLAIDTGFIVFNDKTYPHFIDLLAEIGQESQPSEMSFSVRSEDGALEYNGSSLNTLFAQRSNLIRPAFYRMIRDILRFNSEARAYSASASAELTVGDYLLGHRYGREFTNHYLIPMAAAIWSAEPSSVLDMPVRFLLRFFDNHGLMQLRDRPTWRVITGGSREYVQKLVAGHRDRVRLNNPVRSLKRTHAGVELRASVGELEVYDAVFVACHSDQALRILETPNTNERDVLGAIHYQANEAILHTDERLMPKRRNAWAAWNYHVAEDPSRHVAVTYNMNILQGFSSDYQYCVTLNNDSGIDPRRIITRVHYEHPVFSREAIAAQHRQAELNTDGIFYCGAYWRNGFHEDGVASALHAVQHFEEWLNASQLHLRRAG